MLAGVAGACTAVAMLDATVVRESLGALKDQLGFLGTICLFAILVQGIMASGRREAWNGRIVCGARSALLATLVLILAGAVPAGLTVAPLVVLGSLLSLVEAKARSF